MHVTFQKIKIREISICKYVFDHFQIRKNEPTKWPNRFYALAHWLIIDFLLKYRRAACKLANWMHGIASSNSSAMYTRFRTDSRKKINCEKTSVYDFLSSADFADYSILFD